MKTKAFLITAFVLGSSSVALADVSFSARAQVTWDAGYSSNYSRPVIRDHRTSNRFAQRRIDFRTRVNQVDYYRPEPLPALTGPTWNCHNWDPTVELDSVCGAYASSSPHKIPETVGSWTNVGVRDSAIPGHQFITIERPFRELALQSNTGAPSIVKVAVRFMDGSTKVIEIGERLRGNSDIMHVGGYGQAISQIIVYTTSSSRGTYTVFAR
ncbi:MAG: hypothetical protein ACKV2T_09605 [Kofleriaceae bacterium]